MAEHKQFRAIRGVRDILPPETALWNWFEQTARQVLESYNFREIRLPIFEETDLFARSVGVDTDVVSKEMYSFGDRFLRHLDGLREQLLLEDRNLNPADAASVRLYSRALGRFVEAFGEAVKDEEALRSDRNMRYWHTIATVADPFQRALQNPTENRELLAETQEELKLAVERLQVDVFTLRPEATASVVRAYIEHGMHTLPGLVKLYYMGPMFRRERPQKGRYRQFYQIGAEVLGTSDHPAIDAEVIEMLTVLLERCRLDRWTLLINSIGCKDCRPAYVERLREELRKVKAKLGADSQRRIETNALRVLDSKLPEEQAVIEKLPRITEHLCAACREHFDAVQEQLGLRGIPYEVNWRLVRGLDYYMRTTFEITSPRLGAQNALVGGGRYDGLVELLGGPPAKGIGFALGEDRFIEVIKAAGTVVLGRPLDVFLAWIGEASYPVAMRLARQLRGENLSVEVPSEEMKLKKSLGLADKLGARYAVIIGEDEVASRQFTLKRLADGEQKKLGEVELVAELRGARGL